MCEPLFKAKQIKTISIQFSSNGTCRQTQTKQLQQKYNISSQTMCALWFDKKKSDEIDVVI